MKPKKETPITKTGDPVFDEYGPPFLTDGRKVVLNDRAVAIKCAELHMIKYDTDAKRYERFDRDRGFWVMESETAVARALDSLIRKLGKTYKQQKFVARISFAKLSSLCKMIRPHDVKIESVDTSGLVHASNGVVDLGGNKPKLMPHDARYTFCASSGIKFDAKATCPKFMNKLLDAALAPADAGLVQKYCGSMAMVFLGRDIAEHIAVGGPCGSHSPRRCRWWRGCSWARLTCSFRKNLNTRSQPFQFNAPWTFDEKQLPYTKKIVRKK